MRSVGGHLFVYNTVYICRWYEISAPGEECNFQHGKERNRLNEVQMWKRLTVIWSGEDVDGYILLTLFYFISFLLLLLLFVFLGFVAHASKHELWLNITSTIRFRLVETSVIQHVSRLYRAVHTTLNHTKPCVSDMVLASFSTCVQLVAAVEIPLSVDERH